MVQFFWPTLYTIKNLRLLLQCSIPPTYHTCHSSLPSPNRLSASINQNDRNFSPASAGRVSFKGAGVQPSDCVTRDVTREDASRAQREKFLHRATMST